jgi:hypothetical protein
VREVKVFGMEGKRARSSVLSCLLSDYRRGFGSVIGFIEFLQNKTSNYSTIANSHTLQFITARTKSSQFAVSSPIVA